MSKASKEIIETIQYTLQNNTDKAPALIMSQLFETSEGRDSVLQYLAETQVEESRPVTEEEIEKFASFQKYLIENAPSVATMKKPFTIYEYLKVRKKLQEGKITWDIVQTILMNMENKATLQKEYKSAYLTFNNWSRMSWHKSE